MTTDVRAAAAGFGDSRTIERLAQIGQIADDPEYSPMVDAAFFYGLFLRGHSLDRLRADISVPDEVLLKWSLDTEIEEPFRRYLGQVSAYRKQVLAIFDSLIAEGRQRVLKQ
jgi:hypothetical protein